MLLHILASPMPNLHQPRHFFFLNDRLLNCSFYDLLHFTLLWHFRLHHNIDRLSMDLDLFLQICFDNLSYLLLKLLSIQYILFNVPNLSTSLLHVLQHRVLLNSDCLLQSLEHFLVFLILLLFKESFLLLLMVVSCQLNICFLESVLHLPHFQGDLVERGLELGLHLGDMLLQYLLQSCVVYLCWLGAR
jgi:hypothetical protein